jgi:hypothetical protein
MERFSTRLRLPDRRTNWGAAVDVTPGEQGTLLAVVNVFDARFEYDHADPDGYRGGVARVGEGAGGAELTVKL